MNKKLNILFACDMNTSRPWFRDRIPGIKAAIEKVDCTVKLVDIYGILGEFKYNPTHVNERKNFLNYSNILKANKNFEDNVTQNNPDILILGTADNYHQFLLPQTVRRIKDKGVYVVGILGDDEFNYPTYKFLLGWFDLFIAYVQPCIKFYESFNISKGYFFPNSCYLECEEFEEYHQDTEYDAILIGGPTANRPEMIRALIEADVNVAIYGSPRWEDYQFTKGYYHGFVPTERFDEILSKGKIVLSFLEDHISGNLHMNTKIWEAVRVARVPISTYYKPLETDYGLEEGVNMITYSNIEDLVEKVKYYANNNVERLKLSKNLFNKVKSEFDYALMYENLFKNLMTFKDDSIDKGTDKIDVYRFVDNSNFKYFKTIGVELDVEVLNIINSIDMEKYDYISFNKIENGRRVVAHWPFIGFSNVIFLKKEKKKTSYILSIVRSYVLGRSLHVNQFLVVSDGNTFFGVLNRAVQVFKDIKIIGNIGRYLLRR